VSIEGKWMPVNFDEFEMSDQSTKKKKKKKKKKIDDVKDNSEAVAKASDRGSNAKAFLVKGKGDRCQDNENQGWQESLLWLCGLSQ
jgi:hypothetical protein